MCLFLFKCPAYGNPIVVQNGANMTTLDGYVEQAKVFVQQTFPGAMLEESRQVYEIVDRIFTVS
jgi:hypothetical protein